MLGWVFIALTGCFVICYTIARAIILYKKIFFHSYLIATTTCIFCSLYLISFKIPLIQIKTSFLLLNFAVSFASVGIYLKKYRLSLVSKANIIMASVISSFISGWFVGTFLMYKALNNIFP